MTTPEDGAGGWADGPMFERLMDETVDTMRHARGAIARIELTAPPLHTAEDRRDRLVVLRECSRTTARLTAVMSWLLACKAVAAGGSDQDEAEVTLPAGWALAARLVRVPPSEPTALRDAAAVMPGDLLAAHRRAETLYDRACRLAEQPADR